MERVPTIDRAYEEFRADWSGAFGINNFGDLAVTANSPGGGGCCAGPVWSASGGVSLKYYTWLTGINDSGQAIEKEYFPPHPDGVEAYALAINDSGIVVGWYSYVGTWHVFRWSPPNVFEDLSTPSGTFPGGGGFGQLHNSPTMDINKSGDIVVTAFVSTQEFANREVTYLYHEDGVCELQQPPAGKPSACWRPLDDLIVAPLHIRNTLAINDRGQILVEASPKGLEAREYYLLTPSTSADRTPPVIDDIQPSSLVLWPPNHQMIPVLLKVRAHDDRDPAPICSIVGVTSNEPENGLGDGDTAPDAVQTGPLSVQLRAERDGAGTGRVYTVSVRCRDAAGNSSAGTVKINVPHDRPK